MKKKLIALLLTLTLTLPLAAGLPVSAASSEVDENTMLQILSIIGIINGDENGNLNLGNSVTRAEFVKLAVAASMFKDAATAAAAVSPFSDVRNTHWASGYIKVAVDARWVTGYLDGTFVPDNTVKLEEAATVMLKLLGYTDADIKGGYPEGQLALYRSLKLDKGVSAQRGEFMSRRDCAYLIYNTLLAKNREQKVHVTTLGYAIDAKGDIDYLTLINKEMDGPKIVPPNGSAAGVMGFTPRLVYRNGSPSTLAAVGDFDVVYWIEKLGTAWVSSSRIHGVFESASPNLAAPSKITVSGKEYTLGTSAAQIAVSAIGEFAIGDNITLLIGLDGFVAGVVSAYTQDMTVYGIVTNTGTKQFTNADGSFYSSYFIAVTSAGGNTLEYPMRESNTFALGSLVTVSYSGATPNIKRIVTSVGQKVSGRVNSSATAIDKYTLAQDVEILDVYETSFTVVRPERLAGATIPEDKVLYSKLNAQGELDKLILKDFTGDVYDFIVLTNITEGGGALNSSCDYVYLLNGKSVTLKSARTYLNVRQAPSFMRTGKNGVDLIRNLAVSARLTELSASSAQTNSQTHELWDRVQVYEKVGGNEYLLSSVGHVAANFSSYKTVTAYSDKAESEGGRIRIIIAETDYSSY